MLKGAGKGKTSAGRRGGFRVGLRLVPLFDESLLIYPSNIVMPSLPLIDTPALVFQTPYFRRASLRFVFDTCSRYLPSRSFTSSIYFVLF